MNLAKSIKNTTVKKIIADIVITFARFILCPKRKKALRYGLTPSFLL
jgi:hypothetical protein